jgi:predicted TIM-barrel fold metal-dependent hydrolase
MSPRIVDADAHVIECTQTFAFLRPEEAKYCPMQLAQTWGSAEISEKGNVHKQFWLIDKSVYPVGKNSQMAGTSAATRELRDVDARLKHMDEMGIDVQVLYPTLFLGAKTEDPEWEYALIRSYNRWMADAWAKSDNRLRWVAIPPLRTMDRVKKELEFCKDNGACGIFLAGLECDKQLDHPYFYPLWEIGQELDLAACIHSGNHSLTNMQFCGESRTGDRFVMNRSPGVNAFHVLLADGVPSRYPKMRWGFVEFAASWLPYVLHYQSINKNRRHDKPWNSKTVLPENNMYVACQVSEDLDYLVSVVGEDCLVVGTDYGHNDTASEIDAMRLIRDQGKIDARVANKILDTNARKLYGLN